MQYLKNLIGLFFFFLVLGSITPEGRAQGPQGRNFGFGLVLGEPLGATVKYWTSSENAFVGDIGASYFGSPRIDGDYLWHFDAFHSSIVKLYAGPGLALGFGHNGVIFYREAKGHFYYRDDNSVGVAGRVIFGLNIIPRSTPIEVFLEAGPLIGFSPGFGAAFDAAAGIRFYP